MPDHDRVTALRSKYIARPALERPFFVPQASWDVFYQHVYQGAAIGEIAKMRGASPNRIRQLLAQVDRHLSLPRDGGQEWTRLTANSPVEDLGLSVRCRNRLLELECRRVEDVLRLDFANSRIGRGTRLELLAALERSGFRHPSDDRQSRSHELERLSAKLSHLRARIEHSLGAWRTELERVETRLRKLSGAD